MSTMERTVHDRIHEVIRVSSAQEMRQKVLVFISECRTEEHANNSAYIKISVPRPHGETLALAGFHYTSKERDDLLRYDWNKNSEVLSSMLRHSIYEALNRKEIDEYKAKVLDHSLDRLHEAMPSYLTDMASGKCTAVGYERVFTLMRSSRNGPVMTRAELQVSIVNSDRIKKCHTVQIEYGEQEKLAGESNGSENVNVSVA